MRYSPRCARSVPCSCSRPSWPAARRSDTSIATATGERANSGSAPMRGVSGSGPRRRSSGRPSWSPPCSRHVRRNRAPGTYPAPARTECKDETRGAITPRSEWWSMLDLNQRPPACEAGALPTELIDRDERFYVLAGSASTDREADVPENVPESLWANSRRSPGLTIWSRSTRRRPMDLRQSAHRQPERKRRAAVPVL
jgi:hypothetical protein